MSDTKKQEIEEVILDPQSRKWCLTLNNYTEKEYIEIKNYCSDKNYWIIGREIGENGTEHLQIYIEHKTSIRFSTFKKLNIRLHIEKAKGNKNQNFTYCSKENNYESNYDNLTFREKLIQMELKKYNNVSWKIWQEEILLRIYDNRETRQINWYYDYEGNKGKSFLCKYIDCKYKGVIIADGKKDNIFNQINTAIENEIIPSIIILDIPRSSENYINYGAIEQIKNGHIYSGKYEGGKCIFPIPHVFIFSNFYPDISKYSKDRWAITEL